MTRAEKKDQAASKCSTAALQVLVCGGVAASALAWPSPGLAAKPQSEREVPARASRAEERIEIEARFVEASAEAVREAFSVAGVKVRPGPRILGQALGDVQGIFGAERAEVFWESLAVANDVNVAAQLNSSVGPGRTDSLASVRDFQYSVDREGGKVQRTWTGTRLSLTSRLQGNLVAFDLKPWIRSYECAITTAAVEQPVFSDWKPELTFNLPVESSLVWGLGRHRIDGVMREVLLIVKAAHPRVESPSRGTVEVGELNEVVSSPFNAFGGLPKAPGVSGGESEPAPPFQMLQQTVLKEAPSESSGKVKPGQDQKGAPGAPKNKP
jgi:hypothetical protein